jgi:hypothetical protein
MPTTPYIDLDSVHVPAPGVSPPASWGTTVRDNLEFFARRPGCKVLRSANQSIPNGTWTSVAFTAADAFDTDAFHDTSTDPEQIVIPTGLGGWYQLIAVAQFAANATGNRAIRARVNGSLIYGGDAVDAAQFAGALTAVNLVEEVLLAAGDVLEIQVYHQAGSALNLVAGASGRVAACSIRLSGLP